MSTEHFDEAVAKLVEGGVSRAAAHQLISNAVTRGEPIGLLAWADRLLHARTEAERLRQRINAARVAS